MFAHLAFYYGPYSRFVLLAPPAKLRVRRLWLKHVRKRLWRTGYMLRTSLDLQPVYISVLLVLVTTSKLFIEYLQ